MTQFLNFGSPYNFGTNRDISFKFGTYILVSVTLMMVMQDVKRCCIVSGDMPRVIAYCCFTVQAI